ncbi:unnamed protein product [Sphagnum tenellum]
MNNMPHKPVRVFTYLIGREISDLKAANWMACQNRGMITPSNGTGVYADVEDPKTSRWLWDLRERERQKRRTENYREIMRMQQDSADPLSKIDQEDDTVATKDMLEKLTRLSDMKQMQNFLSYGKWDPLREGRGEAGQGRGDEAAS